METKTKRGGADRTLNRLVGNLLCRVGWHCWTWKLKSGDAVVLDASPPDHATCERCGVRFKKISNDQLRG